jgi:uncharacterized protein (UPF0332 family)
MTEIDSLLEKAKKYLKSAALLLENQDYESCVSRVYYAMFYSVEALLLTKKLSFSSHKGVLSGFGQYFVKTGIFAKELSKNLNKAFEKRQLGDYGSSFVIEKEEAKELLENGQSFVRIITQYLEKFPQDNQENPD